MRSIVLAILGLLFLLAGCGRGEDEAVVVAWVGDEAITAEAFQLNYAFGHGHLRRGDDPRRAYLDLMINEKVLALEAAQLRLDTTAAVIHAMQTLEEELLIERVFEEKVLAGIEVTDEEIRHEINKMAVRFQFRFLPARSEADARFLYEEVRAKGYDRVLDEQRDALAELPIVEGELTSPLLDAEAVDPGILEIIKDLEINTPSLPVLYQGYWYVFEVIDIRRQRLAEEDYTQRTPTYHKVVYNRKAIERATAFVAETMEPLNATTKRQGFEILHEALWQWYRDAPPVRNLLHYIEEQTLDTPYTRHLAANYEVDLVHARGERWSIRTFLKHFTPGRYVLRAHEPRAFKARLADVVALVVRDAVFLEMARREKLREDATYQRALAQWKDKWMFLALRDQLFKNAAAPNTWSPIRRYVDSVAAQYTVRINEAVLDTLSLSVSETNPTMTVHLFKSNSNKMPFPIVDPNWRPASAIQNPSSTE